ncbi:hypothetical protein AVEN_216500-1 [Araneus ventricosus]|uniref:Uncharacterized protein n=1 Tax=Araneus ventricosus TaxID=182803 RepID=A0A4Y2PXU4_ARAVE|nr:hypothetical protein AVEN_216500-1 [Araneus ventricosus]
MFSIEDSIIQLATPIWSRLGHAPVRFRPPTVRRKREKADESISRIHMSTKPPYTKVLCRHPEFGAKGSCPGLGPPLMVAKPTSRSCDILDRRYVLISLEKLLSPVATVTGRVRKIYGVRRSNIKLTIIFNNFRLTRFVHQPKFAVSITFFTGKMGRHKVFSSINMKRQLISSYAIAIKKTALTLVSIQVDRMWKTTNYRITQRMS